LRFAVGASNKIAADAKAAQATLDKTGATADAVSAAFRTTVDLNHKLDAIETDMSAKRIAYDRFMAVNGASSFARTHKRELAAINVSFGSALEGAAKAEAALDALNAAINTANDKLDAADAAAVADDASAIVAAADAGQPTDNAPAPTSTSAPTSGSDAVVVDVPKPVLKDDSATASASTPATTPAATSGTTPPATAAPAPAYDLNGARAAMQRQTQLAAQVRAAADAESAKLIALKNVPASRAAWIAYGAEAGPAGRLFLTQRAALNAIETEMSRIQASFDAAGGAARFGGAFPADSQAALSQAAASEQALSALRANQLPAEQMANALRAQGIAVSY
jgi:hypothetical protein